MVRIIYHIQYMMEKRFEGLQATFVWFLFYSVLLYIEQWCIRRHDSRQIIRKKQIWATVLIIMTRIILLEIECVHLWYIPLSYVDCPNDLEDYYLWWFSLYSAVFLLPFWFFSARKTIRLFINNAQWLTLTTIIPRKISALTALVATGLMTWQIRECRDWNSWIEIADVPEYGEAAAMCHLFQALIWGLVLFYILCLLVKQMWVAHRVKHRL